MADIFISYSKAHRPATAELAADLEAKGYSVWWDTALVSGESFRAVIMAELGKARAAIVIWTAASVHSDWVISEASRARMRGILIPVRDDELDPQDIPPPFDVLHTDVISNRAAIYAALAKLGVQPSGAKPSAEPPAVAPDFREVLALEHWQAIKNTDDPGRLQAFLKEFGSAQTARLARNRLADLEAAVWKRMGKKPSEGVLRRFLSDFPDGAHAGAAAAHLAEIEHKQREQAFARAAKSEDLEAIRQFVAQHPRSHLTERAAELLRGLQAREEALTAARSSSDVAVLRSFLADYPGHKQAKLVRARLRQLAQTNRDKGESWDLWGWVSSRRKELAAGATLAVCFVGLLAWFMGLLSWPTAPSAIKSPTAEPERPSEPPWKEAVHWAAHRGYVSSLAFSPDGKMLVSGGGDTTDVDKPDFLMGDRVAKVWDPQNGRVLYTWGTGKAVVDVAFSPDKQFIGIASLDNIARIADVVTGKLVRASPPFSGVSSVAFSPDGRSVALGVPTRIWDVRSGRVACTLGPPSGGSTAFTPDGKLVATAGLSDGMLRIWNAQTCSLERAFGQGPNTSYGFGFLVSLRDGRSVLSEHGGKLNVWDIFTGQNTRALDASGNKFALSNNEELLVGAGASGIIVREFRTGKLLTRMRSDPHAQYSAVAISPDGRRIAAGLGGTAEIWEAP